MDVIHPAHGESRLVAERFIEAVGVAGCHVVVLVNTLRYVTDRQTR